MDARQTEIISDIGGMIRVSVRVRGRSPNSEIISDVGGMVMVRGRVRV